MRARIACCIPSMSTWAALTAMAHSEMVLYSAIREIAVKSLNQQCSLVSAARNNLVRMALKFEPQPTHIMWVDSVTPETPILVRRIGDTWIDFIEACELTPPCDRFTRGRTYASCNFEVLTHKGWQKPKAVMQARVKKPILRITDERGTISVTEDHSLFSDGQEIAGRDVIAGTPLDHVTVNDLEIPNNLICPVTEEYAEVLGFFAAEGTTNLMSKGEGLANGWFWNISNKDKSLLERYAKVLSSVHARRFIFVEDQKEGYDPVWRLHASYPSELGPQYRSIFYTATGKKRVPKFILNAPANIINAFLRGYEVGDGYERRDGLQCLTTNSSTLAAGLSLLYERVGRNFGTNAQRADKPDIVQMYERKHGLDRLKIPAGVRHIQRDEEYDGWVYDLNTEAGTFVAGTGLFLAHNSDMVFPPETIERLLNHDKDVVGAFYNKRVPPYDTVGHLIGQPDVSPGGLYRADVMPHGVVLVKREVYEKLPQPWYFESFDPAFATEDDPCGMIGEDVNFSRECVKAGIEMWCDADLTFAVGHIGEQVIGCTPPDKSLPRDKAAKTVATFYDGGDPSFGHSRTGTLHPTP
jgi:hypothetical protein